MASTNNKDLIKLTLNIPRDYDCPELRFILEYIFQSRLGLKYSLGVDDEEGVRLSNNGIKLIELGLGEFFLNVPKYILGESKPDVTGDGKHWQLFPFELNSDFSFDLLAGAFFLISRLEEYVDGDMDTHGRYQAKRSVLFDGEVLSYPIVDHWIQQLRNKIETRSEVKLCKRESFEWWNTVDVDQVYASKGKKTIKRIGTIMRNVLKGKFEAVGILTRTFFGFKDPFDNLSEMNPSIDRNIAFLQTGGRSLYDKAQSIAAKKMAELVLVNRHNFEWGIHPSYESSSGKEILKEEIGLFRSIFKDRPTISRQHYLRFSVPGTGILLFNQGVKFDFSMGYASHLGFRAGTSRPFPLFDLNTRSATGIQIVPFCVMDVTLKNYQKLNPNEALDKINALIQGLREVDGLFVSLWHNESLGNIDGWKGWKAVYQGMTKLAFE